MWKRIRVRPRSTGPDKCRVTAIDSGLGLRVRRRVAELTPSRTPSPAALTGILGLIVPGPGRADAPRARRRPGHRWRERRAPPRRTGPGGLVSWARVARLFGPRLSGCQAGILLAGSLSNAQLRAESESGGGTQASLSTGGLN